MTSFGEDGKISIKNSKQGARVIKIAAVLIVAVLAGFAVKNHMRPDSSAKAANMQPPAPAVVLYTVSERDLSPSRSFIGKVEAIQSVSLKSQVSGEIRSVNFKEGAFVKSGQPLFTIDSSRYQATADLRKAELEQEEAALAKAEKYLERVKAADKRSISASDMDAAESAFLQAKASLSQAKAALKACYLNELQLVAVAGNDILFQSLPGAYEAYLRLRLQLFYLVRNGQGRINVSARTAAGKNYLHLTLPPSSSCTSFLK